MKTILLEVTPTLPDRNDPIKVNSVSEVSGVPSLPLDESDITTVPDTLSFFGNKETIEEYKNEMNDGDTLIILEYNPFMFWVDEDFWVGGSNPDYNLPTTHNEQIWKKVDGKFLLTSTFSHYDTYFNQPWSELLGDNVLVEYEHDLGYNICFFEEYGEDDE